MGGPRAQKIDSEPTPQKSGLRALLEDEDELTILWSDAVAQVVAATWGTDFPEVSRLLLEVTRLRLPPLRRKTQGHLAAVRDPTC